MHERIVLLKVIANIVNTVLTVPYFDELLAHGLDSVDIKTRLKVLERVKTTIFRNPLFARTNDYVATLEIVLASAEHRADQIQ
jgi:hypothetical protein